MTKDLPISAGMEPQGGGSAIASSQKKIQESFLLKHRIICLIVSIVACYRHLSADIKMKNFMIKTSLANKTVINFMIFILILMENCQ